MGLFVIILAYSTGFCSAFLGRRHIAAKLEQLNKNNHFKYLEMIKKKYFDKPN